jgi:cobalt-zinc-cadmium efflux system membrane fusion protein
MNDREGSETSRPQSRLEAATRAASVVAVLACLALAWWWLATHHFAGEGHEASEAAGDRAKAPEAAAETVRLPEGVDVAVVVVGAMPLQDVLTVPGRIDYDARRQVDYLAPVDGIATNVSAVVRQEVARGDVLAELSSREVGMARDEVDACEDRRRIAAEAAEWASTIAGNVESLLASLETHPPLERVQEAFAKRPLGENRDRILGAYSALVHAQKVNAGTRTLVEGGLLSGRIVEERQAKLESTAAKFRAACEEARFDTRQESRKAEAELRQAERVLEIAKEHLLALVGTTEGTEPDSDAAGLPASNSIVPDAMPAPDDADDSLSTLDLRSPIAGVVEDVFVARGERVTAGQRLFVVADTSTLWVRAQIHERQWTAVEVAPGEEVRVVVPGAGEHETKARISHVGSVVDEESRSVPLVAVLEGDDAHFKPGMFVWVDLPQGPPRERLVVPSESVMRHEGRAFVFVPAGDRSYRRRDVRTGIESAGQVEVVEGLSAGESVVARGAFVLKSRLLIEREGAGE